MAISLLPHSPYSPNILTRFGIVGRGRHFNATHLAHTDHYLSPVFPIPSNRAYLVPPAVSSLVPLPTIHAAGGDLIPLPPGVGAGIDPLPHGIGAGVTPLPPGVGAGLLRTKNAKSILANLEKKTLQL